jgi:hypothetical protein
LIQRLEDPDRRVDGTFTHRPGDGDGPRPWRFLIRPERLEQNAHRIVVEALHKRATSPTA